jgi:predicted ribosomally synthesized peptide with nif11-like leader
MTMSVESAKAFLEKLKADESFCKQVAEIDSTEDFFYFVNVSGFDFSEEEWGETVGNPEGDELSDSDLSNAAGGWSTAHMCQTNVGAELPGPGGCVTFICSNAGHCHNPITDGVRCRSLNHCTVGPCHTLALC